MLRERHVLSCNYSLVAGSSCRKLCNSCNNQWMVHVSPTRADYVVMQVQTIKGADRNSKPVWHSGWSR